ncbi:HNH endonuclease [Niabella hibiscisoli]|uniref:HNH endonuclease n=1 Tax=Niabella hibiscisoli TaxID=1825928 RepID=UPI001F0D1876|nr:HNH endonuclease [Niabella hibiscisoli]MCH5719843.1 HNH endonuclease [Niabella hibiscisoli]MCH5719857.1 HNH endonuclease [Niabella hibiscisoli]
MFEIGNKYTKRDIYKILDVPPERQRGAWDKGYREYEGNYFIFSNVGIPGRTGHDYNNYWDGDLFVWEGATTSHLKQPQIDAMLHPAEEQKIFLFTRTEDKAPFVFEGNVVAKEYQNTTPVKVVWKFENYPYNLLEEPTYSGLSKNTHLREGTTSKISVNKYERNPLARRMCIAYHGALCKVCQFDFYLIYGDIGKGYIHVHHIIPISSIGKEYVFNPEQDLIPVCPNCHSIIHKRKPIFSIEELKGIVEERRITCRS